MNFSAVKLKKLVTFLTVLVAILFKALKFDDIQGILPAINNKRVRNAWQLEI